MFSADAMISATPERPTYDEDVVGWFHQVLLREAETLRAVIERLNGSGGRVHQACTILRQCRTDKGNGKRAIVAGVGKAGLIGRKVAATLSSTGTPAVFVHPLEALHGDLGGVCRGDCGLLLSYSGETPEIVRLADELVRLDCPVIAVTRSAQSRIGRVADVVLELGEISEACEHGLAPSSTTTAMLAIGDALALAVAKASGFSSRDFAVNHPAGMLGLRFRQASEFMRTGLRLVCIRSNTPIQEVVRKVSAAKTGAAVLVDDTGRLEGIFTDGDLRRALLAGGDVLSLPVESFATCACAYVTTDTCVADAYKQMLDRRIEDLPVLDRHTALVVGLLCLKDIKW